MILSARVCLIATMLACMTMVTFYALKNPKQTCSKIYQYSALMQEEKELGLANLRIAELQEELGKVIKWKHGLAKMQEKNLVAEAARLECMDHLEEAKLNFKTGDNITFKNSAGEWKNGTVRDRPICIQEAGQADPECYYMNIKPPQADKQKVQAYESMSALLASEAEKNILKAELEKRFAIGDSISVKIKDKWSNATVTRIDGVFVKVDGSAIEECVFPNS
eukprot:TRINITY_DN10141_c0_g1_i1.p1 TRINITY_DN10141_c0_g1~~TRINITY_DN10141_c0_g1_i1.p1  ORF type:complete len:247 (+),score=61.97 TRINITY_DN10141_c0_g1_i1:76-741(+)